MSSFFFAGSIPASKSLLNRWQLVASYTDHLALQGDSQCDDVRLFSDGLASLKLRQDINCGAAGTVFRFLSLKASRVPGRHVLIGTERLLSRPHQDLQSILSQLG